MDHDPPIEGFFKVYYRLQHNPIWKQLSPAVFKVAMAFLMKANFKPSYWYDGDKQIDLPVGSFVTSYAQMASFCNLSIKQIRDAFEHLEKLSFSTYSRAQRYTVVSVCNYAKYQSRIYRKGTDEGIDKGTIGARSGQDEGTIGAPVSEVKNIQNPNNHRHTSARANGIDYTDLVQWFVDEYPKNVFQSDIQLLLSVVESEKDATLLRKNLPLWKATDEWQRGMVPSAEKFLSKRMWMQSPREPPKAVDTNTRTRAKSLIAEEARELEKKGAPVV